MSRGLMAFAMCGIFLYLPAQSDAQINLRAGLSSVSGLVGAEYQAGNLAGSIGYLRGDKLRLPVSVRYLKNAEGSSLWGAVSLITNNANGLVNYEAWFEDLDNIVELEEEYYHTVGLTVGYRKRMGEALDFSIGFGYGTHMGVSDSATDEFNDEVESGLPFIDLSFGYRF
jgi:hypothetical protein